VLDRIFIFYPIMMCQAKYCLHLLLIYTCSAFHCQHVELGIALNIV